MGDPEVWTMIQTPKAAIPAEIKNESTAFIRDCSSDPWRPPSLNCSNRRERLFLLAGKPRNPAGVFPQFNAMTIGHLLGSFPCGVVVSAVEVDSFDGMAVTSNKVCSIVRHYRRSLN